jgi:hypothetical protein
MSNQNQGPQPGDTVSEDIYTIAVDQCNGYDSQKAETVIYKGDKGVPLQLMKCDYEPTGYNPFKVLDALIVWIHADDVVYDHNNKYIIQEDGSLSPCPIV